MKSGIFVTVKNTTIIKGVILYSILNFIRKNGSLPHFDKN